MMCGPECKPESGCEYWDGDFAGNPAGYPVGENPYIHWHIDLGAEVAYRVPTPAVPEPPNVENLATLRDALDLVIELWPKPGYQTVALETHQWIKLRRVLLAIPHLVAADE